MCGICGFVGDGDLQDLERMVQALVHRGPDDEGLWKDEAAAVFLGHRRLAVIDLAGGRQPMWTDDGRIGVIYNGEIYNHPEIRRHLEKRGHRFKTDHSDTEVLLHGYREWGEGLPGHLNGMWAWAIYDRDRERLFLSRDRFGKKPLYYTHQAHFFAFASELSALTRHARVGSTLSKMGLKKYFAYGFIPSPGSLFENIQKLPGGYNLTFGIRHATLERRRYWRFVLEPSENIPKNPEARWGAEIREKLHRSVKRRLLADVPLGFFISGGIDSSAIVATAAQILPADQIKTFCIGFEEKSFDESKQAEAVARYYATDHTQQILSINTAGTLLPAVIDRLDEPMGDSSLLPTYLLCRQTRQRVTVALSGDGGDELFAGYDPFRAMRLAYLYKRLIPRPIHPAIRWAASLLPVSHRNMSIDFKIKRALRGLSYPSMLWNPVWLGPLEPGELDELFQEPTDIESVYAEAIALWEDCESDHPLDKTLQFYTRLYLQEDILVKTDRASMMNSLEVRAPFLDIELVDLVRRIPHQWKYRHGQTKYILKQAMRPWLPTSAIQRAKKGFGVPVGRWMKDDRFSPDEAFLPPALSTGFIRSCLKAHRRGRRDHRAVLWNAWLLAEYLKRGSIRPGGAKAIRTP